jgi:hypothetical protein
VSEQSPRPAWPGAAPVPAPAQERRTVDLKIVIAVLIGLVSVTGAVVTWRSAQLNEQATDKDRQAIAETVRVEQDAANDEITLQDARGRVAAHAAAITEAELLEEQADRFAGGGDPETADDLADEADELRAVAERYLQGGTTSLLLVDYVVVDEATGRRSLDERRFRDDLRSVSQAQSQVDPSQTVRDANRLRDDSQHLDGWLVPLVSAIVLLTLAQVSRQRLLRLGLTGAGTAVWIVATVLAFGGS